MKVRLQTLARFWLVVGFCAMGVPGLWAADSTWAKAGVSLPVGCEESSDVQRVLSPDGTASVEVRCAGLNRDGDGVVLRIRRRNRSSADLKLEIEPGSYWRPQELVWAPDSSAFVVNGSESAYAGGDFVVYWIGGDRITSARITGAAQRDMVATLSSVQGQLPRQRRLPANRQEPRVQYVSDRVDTWLRPGSLSLPKCRVLRRTEASCTR